MENVMRTKFLIGTNCVPFEHSAYVRNEQTIAKHHQANEAKCGWCIIHSPPNSTMITLNFIGDVSGAWINLSTTTDASMECMQSERVPAHTLSACYHSNYKIGISVNCIARNNSFECVWHEGKSPTRRVNFGLHCVFALTLIQLAGMVRMRERGAWWRSTFGASIPRFLSN